MPQGWARIASPDLVGFRWRVHSHMGTICPVSLYTKAWRNWEKLGIPSKYPEPINTHIVSFTSSDIIVIVCVPPLKCFSWVGPPACTQIPFPTHDERRSTGAHKRMIRGHVDRCEQLAVVFELLWIPLCLSFVVRRFAQYWFLWQDLGWLAFPWSHRSFLDLLWWFCLLRCLYVKCFRQSTRTYMSLLCCGAQLTVLWLSKGPWLLVQPAR